MQYNLSRNNFGGFVEILGENEMCGYRYNISIADGKRTGQHHGNVFWISDFAGENRRVTSNNNFIYNNTVFIPSINDVNNNPMNHLEIFLEKLITLMSIIILFTLVIKLSLPWTLEMTPNNSIHFVTICITEML